MDKPEVLLQPEIQDFIEVNLEKDVGQLALLKNDFSIDYISIINQIVALVNLIHFQLF